LAIDAALGQRGARRPVAPSARRTAGSSQEQFNIPLVRRILY
jgi:hypothetical protein